MKKIVFLSLLLSVNILFLYSQNRKELYKRTKIALVSPIQSDTLNYADDRIDIHFSPEHEYDGYYFIGVSVTNKTTQRASIEWENARICGSKVVFNDDRRMFMKEKKEDEVIIAGEKSEMKSIMPIKNVGDHSLYAFFYDNSTGKTEIPIIIPIHFSDEIIDYKFSISFSKYSETEIDSMYALQKKHIEQSKLVKKKMTIQQVIEIMGEDYEESYIISGDGHKRILELSYSPITIWLDQNEKVRKIEK